MSKWYETTGPERQKIYNQYSVKDFFEWWQNDPEEFMELRFDDWKKAQECSRKHKLKHNKASVFINTYENLINVLRDYRETNTIWFGINPRRPIKNAKGYNVFSGKDINVSKIKFLFLDIDREKKEGPATTEDLMRCDILAEKILKELSTEGFNKNYIKICSANGIQLLVRLDVPVNIPRPVYDSKNNIYTTPESFDKIKNLLKNGIGKVLKTYNKKYVNELNVSVDTTGFNIGRIGALPYTKNFKYGQKRDRGIVEIKNDGVNEGFAEYLSSLYSDSDKRVVAKKNITPVISGEEYTVSLNNLHANKIIKLMIDYEFPDGGINNTLWYAAKILLHQNGITEEDAEFRKVHEIIKQIHGRSFTTNGLEKKYQGIETNTFNNKMINTVPFIVNKYLRNHKIKQRSTGKIGFLKPLFPVSPLGKTKHEVTIKIPEKVVEGTYEVFLDEEKIDPLKDLQQLSEDLSALRLADNEEENIIETFKAINEVLLRNKLETHTKNFCYAFEKKWGAQKLDYMKKYYFDDYINYYRWH